MSPFWLIRASTYTNKRPQYAKQLSSSTARKWRRLIIAQQRDAARNLLFTAVVGSFGCGAGETATEKGRQNWLSYIYIKGALVNLNPTLDEKQNNADHYSPLSTAELYTEKEKTRRTTERDPRLSVRRPIPSFYIFVCVCPLCLV